MLDEIDLEKWNLHGEWLNSRIGSEESINGFRKKLESRARLKSIFDAVRPLLPLKVRETEFHTNVEVAVTHACYSALMSSFFDWRASRQARQEEYASEKATKVQQLTALSGFLELNSEFNLPDIARRMQISLQGLGYEGDVLPFPQGNFVIDLIKSLADAIDQSRPLEDPRLDHATTIGCLNFGESVVKAKKIGLRSLLAFNLELIFRSASLGSSTFFGRMPSGGRPNRPLNAQLLNAIFSGPSDSRIDNLAIGSVIKSILRHDGVRLVPWIIGPDGPPLSSQ